MSAFALNTLVVVAHQTAVNHGWWEQDRPFSELIALCHSELSEALEEARSGHWPNETYYGPDGKPEGVPTELADVLIRIFDLCGRYDIDLGIAVAEKMAYNEGRPRKHGKEF